MQVDQQVALTILEQEVVGADRGEAPEDWVERVRKLEALLGGSNMTFIAALGTAILAKATDLRLNAFALKASANLSGAYSARTLCQHVLAAHAPRLGIDLGVTGREPLNNQPFFAEELISERLPVKPAQRPALAMLLECLRELQNIPDAKTARGALRAFIKARRRAAPVSRLSAGSIGQLTLGNFITLVETFVAERSEKGKRAQAVVAGLLDVYATEARVMSGRINDPDKRFPGDVAVLDALTLAKVEQAFEVRDKPLLAQDLYHFATKAAERDVGKAFCVAAAGLDFPAPMAVKATRWALDRGVALLIYVGWPNFIPEVFNWSGGELEANIAAACLQIEKRLHTIEASPQAMASWTATVAAAPKRT